MTVKTYDCVGCHSFCYGGYHMEEDRDGWGDWVRKEDYATALDLLREVAALKRRDPNGSRGYNTSTLTINFPKSLLERIDALTPPGDTPR